MANKFIIILKDGQLTKKTVRKPDAPRPLDKWLRAVSIAAQGWRAQHCVFRFHGKWHVIHTYAPSAPRHCVLKVFDEQTAAEMYLLTKGLT